VTGSAYLQSSLQQDEEEEEEGDDDDDDESHMLNCDVDAME